MAEVNMVGLFSLLPAVADVVKIPVVATGGIADARGIAAALVLGASAVQIGTGFLRCPEAKLPKAWLAPPVPLLPPRPQWAVRVQQRLLTAAVAYGKSLTSRVAVTTQGRSERTTEKR
jgi:imidazole glycerol phosphate synthase subunit HisF